MIEGDSLYGGLFPSHDLGLDFTSGLVPDSPNKFGNQSSPNPNGAMMNGAKKDNTLNIHPDYSCSPVPAPIHLNPHHYDDSYGANGIVPDSSMNQNHMPKKIDFMNEPMKHFFVPESMEMSLNNVPVHSMQNNNMKGVMQPLKSSKRKEDDNKMKKRKFITSTPVKSENGTLSLIPTTDGGGNPEEEKHQKRQRRLVKNREAAQLFRQRQKAYIQDLEKKVSDLTSSNSEFRARVELLGSENKLIREQMGYLRNFITQAVSFSFPKQGGSGSPQTPGSMPQGMPSPLPPGILPPGMMNLQNPMIMSAIAEATKSSAFRQNMNSVMSIPSPPSLV
eukprot:gene14172-16704_t